MFEVVKQDTQTNSRAGYFKTDRGDIFTPVFMPVGTRGTVRGVHQKDLVSLGASIILGNTYHLYLKPGIDIISQAGGLHRFINWNKPILTDSGGFQVFSLSSLRDISEDGVTFKSHIDGSKHMFTPESVIAAERSIGSDIIMPLDECPPFGADESYIKKSSELTLSWAERSKKHFTETSPLYDSTQFLFGITQGGTFEKLRLDSSHALIALDFDGYAIGGLAVGEPEEKLYRTLDFAVPVLPDHKPRYLMGVGTPANILNGIEKGVDMFDCVIPTREGRNGRIYTSCGTLSIRSSKYTSDFSPVDEYLESPASSFSKAYIRHLLNVNELLGLSLCAVHNIAFYLWLARTARTHILEGNFKEWKDHFLENFSKKRKAIT